ncbi:MAG: GTPase [Alphaproteobacteria bacterium]|nr:GTPase [Alphaproteobacteria bacterium]
MNGRRTRVVIVGAAGRDFHNFNVAYRGDPAFQVVAFTATQIPGIAGRRYPPSLAGTGYPEGIAIVPEAELDALCRQQAIDRVVFSYSDVPHATVMHLAARALAAGADFELLGPRRTMLASRRPVIAVSAVRTGCGKSQVSRHIAGLLRQAGRRAVVVRHPMPYGDLEAQRCQRFATMDDLATARCTNEEREEYEPHIANGTTVFAGVDYADVLAAAEREADIIVWDGGNNDFPFFRPDLHFCVIDALRPDQLDTHHPGETALRMADAVIINKIDAAAQGVADDMAAAVRRLNPGAIALRAASPVRLDEPGRVRGRRVVVVEDGPTITHGGMATGAGFAAARAAGAEPVDVRSVAAPALKPVFEQYPHIGPVLPAIGYDARQLEALAATIDAADAEAVISATPLDLRRLVTVGKPLVRARYDYADAGEPTLAAVLARFLAGRAGTGR